MSKRLGLLLFLLMLLVPVSAQSTTGEIPVVEMSADLVDIKFTVNTDSPINSSKYHVTPMNGLPVVFYGENADQFNELYNFSLVMSGETDNSTKNVALGVMLQDALEHSLVIKGYTYSPSYLEPIDNWVEETFANVVSESYQVLAIRTELEYHEPYGVLETQTELLKVNDTSSEFDWYDVTVTQTLIPGANTSGSDWEWGWLTYTMNGSKGESNLFLSDYDAPPSNELPTGLFSFLWRILNFHPRDYFPWFYQSELDVEGVDMSDFSLETFTVRYQAPNGYQRADEPLEMRHHYVLRVGDGEKPKFWQQTQVKYVRVGTIAAPPYFSPLMHEGYLELR